MATQELMIDRAQVTDDAHELVSSRRVEGTAVYNKNEERLGTIHSVMIEKRTGKVTYAVMSFGGFLGMAGRVHPIPWEMLTYDVDLDAYVVDLTRDQRLGVRPGPRGERQDRVMDVDHPVAAAVDERRQLVHPAAIVAVVISILLHPFPAGAEQRRLDVAQGGAGHQDVEIADRSSFRGSEPSGGVRGSLQQHDRDAKRRQRPPRHLRFPKRRGPRLRGIGAGVFHQRLDPLRQRNASEPVRQAREQRLRPRGRNQPGPVRGPERGGGFGPTKQPHEATSGAAHPSSLHSRSTRSIACSVPG